MFEKILIANRGEIAIRVMTACQQLGVKTVAVYSEVDENAPHVRYADEAICIGPAQASQSYLNIAKIIDAAKKSGAQAIHPGYGFLAENAAFAKSCKDAGLVFIGPSDEVIALMGDKIEAKKVMEKAKVPVIPGYHGKDQSTEKLLAEGKKIGFPLLVKAAAGGGGKGMRIVESEKDLSEAIEGAKREAKSSFGNESVLLERYISKPRHIEFQILADNHGNTIHLYERECSIQRRHQKIVEETPSPALNDDLRKKMGEASVRAAETVGYINAGTIEFMLDEKNEFYFMEMNTRLQVEHPVTEYVTGIDLVKWQLRIASDEKLSIKQSDVSQRGHAIECRIYAEDPRNNFLPSVGLLETVEPAVGPNIRNDTGVESGFEVSPFYDPLLAKLVAFGVNRADAISNMSWALSRYVILGVTTNISFLKAVIDHEAFASADITTHFVEKHFKKWFESAEVLPVEVVIALSVFDAMNAGGLESVRYKVSEENDPWKTIGHWRMSE